MIFSELYSAYYNTVAKIITCAINWKLSKRELYQLISEYAFSESFIPIESALKNEKWQLINRDLTTQIKHIPDMPLTILQKRWLKSISMDSRIKLSNIDFSNLDDVEPLFTPDDFIIFDKYCDGDNFEDKDYIHRFSTILGAVKSHQPLDISMISKRDKQINITVVPEYLEYSEKDDKFRLITSGCRHVSTINLSRIKSCKLCTNQFSYKKSVSKRNKKLLVLELADERNALERIMMHFAHFQKEAEKIDEKHYKVIIYYDHEDETEMVIRVLSFGPFIKVISPESVIFLIRDRLITQKNYELF